VVDSGFASKTYLDVFLIEQIATMKSANKELKRAMRTVKIEDIYVCICCLPNSPCFQDIALICICSSLLA
jgi:hypothetical protein